MRRSELRESESRDRESAREKERVEKESWREKERGSHEREKKRGRENLFFFTNDNWKRPRRGNTKENTLPPKQFFNLSRARERSAIVFLETEKREKRGMGPINRNVFVFESREKKKVKSKKFSFLRISLSLPLPPSPTLPPKKKTIFVSCLSLPGPGPLGQVHLAVRPGRPLQRAHRRLGSLEGVHGDFQLLLLGARVVEDEALDLLL